MGCGGIQPRETDFVGRAWCGRGLRDRHPSTTRPTARSLPFGARATGRQGGPSTASRSHSPRTSSARLVDRTATGRHASVASAESHSVMSPRWTKVCSYADQCPTRYVVLYFGWTFDFMSRSCTRSGHRGQRAYSCLVAAEGLCTNAPLTSQATSRSWERWATSLCHEYRRSRGRRTRAPVAASHGRSASPPGRKAGWCASSMTRA